MTDAERTARWRAMILQAESPQAIEYIKRACERTGDMTPELKALIAKQEREIEECRYASPV